MNPLRMVKAGLRRIPWLDDRLKSAYYGLSGLLQRLPGLGIGQTMRWRMVRLLPNDEAFIASVGEGHR